MQNRKHNFLLLTVATIISLLLAELVLRAIPFRKSFTIGTTRTTKAKLYGWAMEPNSTMPFVNPDTRKRTFFFTNSQGWKDVEHKFEKPAGTFRILVLGDSYTYGMVPLEELYTRQVELLLKQKGHRNVEVITIAAGGWGTDQELEALVQEGVKYTPDIVIYQFCENDLDNNLLPTPTMQVNELTQMYLNKPFRYEVTQGKLRRINLQPGSKAEKASAKRQVKDFLLKSALIDTINILRNMLFRNPDAGNLAPPSTNITETPETEMVQLPHKQKEESAVQPLPEKNKTGGEENKDAPWWVRFPLNPNGINFIYSIDNELPHPHPGWLLLEALLLEMKTVSRASDAQFLVFSESGDLGRRKWNMEWNRIQTDGESDFIQWQGKNIPVNVQRPLKELEKICQRNEIPLIKPKREYVRYHNDLHTNREGNKRMAEDIVDYLIGEQYLGAEAK